MWDWIPSPTSVELDKWLKNHDKEFMEYHQNLYGNIHFFPMISVTGMVAGFDWNIDQMISSGEVLVSTLIHDTNGGRVQPPFVFKK